MSRVYKSLTYILYSIDRLYSTAGCKVTFWRSGSIFQLFPPVSQKNHGNSPIIQKHLKSFILKKILVKTKIFLVFCLFYQITAFNRKGKQRVLASADCWNWGKWKVETQREQMKGILPWLVLWAFHVGTRDFCFSLAYLVGPVQNTFFPHPVFQFICPNCPARWPGSRAELPVS